MNINKLRNECSVLRYAVKMFLPEDECLKLSLLTFRMKKNHIHKLLTTG